MKILHTSDWHFGMRVGTSNYEDCQRHFIDQLCDLIEQEHVGAVLCAGDVFDSRNVGADAIALFDYAADEICDRLSVPFIVIAGNHDSPERLAAHSRLLRHTGLYIFGTLQRDIQPVLLDAGKVAVYPLPYFNRFEVATYWPKHKDEIRGQEDATLVVCDAIRESMDPSRMNIVMSHAFIVGAELSKSDRAAEVGTATAVSKEVFADFDYVALGHIHKPQFYEKGRIRYSGSPLKYSFGSEEQQTKGVVLIDTDDGCSSRFIPLTPLRDRSSAEGTFEELMERDDLKDCYLKLKVTDRYAGLETWDELKKRFHWLLELSGIQTEDVGGESTLSIDELEKLRDEDILIKFLAERFNSKPTQTQLEMFREAMAETEEE